MNNEKVAEYLDLIGSLYYKGVDFAKTDATKKARKSNGVLYKNAAKAVRAQTEKVSEMTAEQIIKADIKGVKEAMAETITSLQNEGEDRAVLTKFLAEYAKQYPKAEFFLKEREKAETGREKINNLRKILAVSEGKTYISSIDWYYHLVMLAEALNFLEEKEQLQLVYDTMEKVRAGASSDLIEFSSFTEEAQETAEFSLLNLNKEAGAALTRYLVMEKGVPNSVVAMAIETYNAYNDSTKEDMESLLEGADEYVEVGEAISILNLVDSPLSSELKEISEHTAEEYFETYEEKRAKPASAPKEKEVKPAPAPKEKEVKPAPTPSTDKRTYRQRVIDLLGSMADGYSLLGRIQLSNLYRDTAQRIEGAMGKQFKFDNMNELKQVVYRKKLLAPTEITEFISRYESGKLSDDEKKVLLRGEKQYSERKEKEVVGNTPITKPEIIAFLTSLAASESSSGSAENARLYREVVKNLTAAKAEVNSAKEGYETIRYSKPLLPLEVALLVEEYATKAKKKVVEPTFDYKTLLSKKALNLHNNEDITVKSLALNEDELSEADRLLLYWGPALGPSTREQAKAIILGCSLVGGINVNDGVQVWKLKGSTTLEKALAGPLAFFTRGRFTAKDKTYLILQVTGAEAPFLLEVIE